MQQLSYEESLQRLGLFFLQHMSDSIMNGLLSTYAVYVRYCI